MERTEKKIAVVVGGGNGIGEACCELMAERGWKVVVADFDLEGAQQVAARINSVAYKIDVRDTKAVEELAATIEKEVGPVEALAIPAGIVQDKFHPEEFPMEQYRNILAVNIEGTFNCCRAFGPYMAKRRKGSIVAIASSTAYIGHQLYAYGPSKAAVINLVRSLAGEWGRSGVRVNSISPGPTVVKRQLKRAPGRYAPDAELHLAMGRRLAPREIAEGVEFLSSDRSSAVTGIDLLMDAGQAAGAGWGFFGGVPSEEDRKGVLLPR
jgi:NAD(P)-dependent dehydrogenase (short-subunit alcohol dehydrogenase family)